MGDNQGQGRKGQSRWLLRTMATQKATDREAPERARSQPPLTPRLTLESSRVARGPKEVGYCPLQCPALQSSLQKQKPEHIPGSSSTQLLSLHSQSALRPGPSGGDTHNCSFRTAFLPKAKPNVDRWLLPLTGLGVKSPVT